MKRRTLIATALAAALLVLATAAFADPPTSTTIERPDSDAAGST